MFDFRELVDYVRTHLRPQPSNIFWLGRLFSFFAKNTHLLFARLNNDDYENFLAPFDMEQFNDALASAYPGLHDEL